MFLRSKLPLTDANVLKLLYSKMSACCVFGCKNRSYTTNLKFLRIPEPGHRRSNVNRRKLWLQALEKVNGSVEGLEGNVRVCGAHFISGDASIDRDSPDFVPSVFKNRPGVKKKAKWVYGQRKRRRRSAKAETEDTTTTPPRVDSPIDLQSSVLMEEIPTPSVPKEGEAEEAEPETETNTVNSQTFSPNKTSPSFKTQTEVPKLDKQLPIVLLKSVFSPACGYRCELCDQNFTNVSQLVKHKVLHEGKDLVPCEMCGKIFPSLADISEHQCVLAPSFPCNICDRSFTSRFQLKRHKLQHVKDGRKCQKCGVLFCKRHGHIVYKPQTQSEQDEFNNKPKSLDSNFMPENSQVEKPEPTTTTTTDLNDDTQKPPLPALNTRDFCEKLFSSLADISKHSHVIAPIFPCNICNRSFSSSFDLKRHKLQHVKDGRKCLKCGVLFCKLHGHILYKPQTQSEQDAYNNKPQSLDSSLVVKPEPTTSQDDDDDAQSSMQTILPTPPNHGYVSKAPLPALHTTDFSEIPVPMFITRYSVPRQALPLPRYSWNTGMYSQLEPNEHDHLAAFVKPQDLELPPSLKMFSPRYLTSAFIEVKRNYQYILSKPRDARLGDAKWDEAFVKEEPHEMAPISPDEQSVEYDGKERTAYDVQIVL